jgi:CheY-like chemotaxis protein
MPKRILIVDDDEMVLMALDELLSPEGSPLKVVLLLFPTRDEPGS